MKNVHISDLARSLGLSEAELTRKLTALGASLKDGYLKVDSASLMARLVRGRQAAPSSRETPRDVEDRALEVLEHELELTETAAKVVELAHRAAFDMAHPVTAGPHVLIALLLVADADVERLEALQSVARGSLLEAVAGRRELFGQRLLAEKPKAALSEVLRSAEKQSSWGPVSTEDLLSAILAEALSCQVLDQVGVDRRRLKRELRGGRR